MFEFQVDEIVPSEVVSPTDVSELTRTLSELHAQGSAVVPWGGGTRMAVGNVPRRYDVALDMTGMSENVDHVAGDMTVVCDAGVRIADLVNLLAASNQRLPFEVPNPRSATIGGSVASNAPSRLRPRFGGIRDWIIGLHVVLADGTRTKTGGRVVKNVQGYDLHRLHTGAYGTLGVITSVALKLVPLPERTRSVAMWFDRYGAAANAARDVGKLELTIESARLYSGARAAGAIRELASSSNMDGEVGAESAEHLMLVKVSGSISALNRQVDELTGLAGTVPANGYESLVGSSETELWNYLEEAEIDGKLSLRIAAKATDSVNLVDRLTRWLERNRNADGRAAIIDVGYGSFTFNIDVIDDDVVLPFIDAAKNLTHDVGGSLLVERCPLSIKKDIDVFGIDTSSTQIMKNMKNEFDSTGTLNPGRFAFGI